MDSSSATLTTAGRKRGRYKGYKGKIGRLPEQIRDAVNRRLLDGWPAAKVIAWLHDRPTVRRILVDLFDGRPITDQNITDWRHTGFADWMAAREARAIAVEVGRSKGGAR